MVNLTKGARFRVSGTNEFQEFEKFGYLRVGRATAWRGEA